MSGEKDAGTSRPLFIEYEHSDGLFGLRGLGSCNSEKT